MIKFDNGFGASIIDDYDLFELAVIGRNGKICYDSPVTSDVVQGLTFDQVARLLDQIKSFPAEDFPPRMRYSDYLDDEGTS